MVRRRTQPKLDDEKRKRHEAPTLPPPASAKEAVERERDAARNQDSGVRVKKGSRVSVPVAATVDEVIADLSKDPRRES